MIIGKYNVELSFPVTERTASLFKPRGVPVALLSLRLRFDPFANLLTSIVIICSVVAARAPGAKVNIPVLIAVPSSVITS